MIATQPTLDVEHRDEELLVRLAGQPDRLALRELRVLLRALLADPEEQRPVRLELPPGARRQPALDDAIGAAEALARLSGRELVVDGAPPQPVRTWSSPLLDDDLAGATWRPRRRAGRLALVIALYAVAMIAVLVPSARAATTDTSTCSWADLSPGDEAAEAQAAWSVRCLVNAERAEADLRPLLRDDALQGTATRFAARMVGELFFSHVASDGETLADRLRHVHQARRHGFVVGENLAWGDGTRATPRATVAAWMASPSHRAVLLHPAYLRFGVGVRVGSPRGSRPAPAATYVLHAGAWGVDGQRRLRASRRMRAAKRS